MNFVQSSPICYFAITIDPLNKKSLMLIRSDKHFIRVIHLIVGYLSSLEKVRMGRSDKLTTFTKLLPAYLLA